MKTFYIVKHLKKAAFILDITYHYRQRPQSIMLSTDRRTSVINSAAIYDDILTNLTPGYEEEELNFYSRRIGALYSRFVHDVPEVREVFVFCREKCKVFGGFLWMKQVAYYYLGAFKYSRTLWSLMFKKKI